MDNKNVFVAIAYQCQFYYFGAFFETPRQVKEPSNNKIVKENVQQNEIVSIGQETINLKFQEIMQLLR